jgi:PIN domain nuclease of toxin-antitoxin system
MHQFLLDTHIFLHLINGEKNVPQRIVSVLQEGEPKKMLSIASIWEMAIKIGLGKLAIVDRIDTIYRIIEEHDIMILHIDKAHFETFLTLPEIHKDPFDRLIISQAITEDLTLVTDDQFIKSYPNLKLI